MRLIRGIPNGDYHDLKLTNSSLLKAMWSSTPAHVYHDYFSGEEKPENRNLVFGSMIHMAILEPEKFDDCYIVMPDGLDRRTKEGKALWADIQGSGKEPIKQSEWDAYLKMGASVLSLDFFRRNNPKKALKEASLIDEGGDRKCRLDLIFAHEEHVYIIDLKTTQDASMAGFQRSAYKLGYHIQAAWYTDMAIEYFKRPVTFMFACVEKKSHLSAMYEANPQFIEQGRKDYQQAQQQLEFCLQADQWPGYPTETQELGLPHWVIEANEINEIEI